MEYQEPKIIHMTYGKFNPPTIGHGLIFEMLVRQSEDEGGDIGIFTSAKKLDKKKTFLTPNQKIEALKGHFAVKYPDIQNVRFGYDNIATILRELNEEYDVINFYVGTDRAAGAKGGFGWVTDRYENVVLREPVGIERNERHAVSGDPTHISSTLIRKEASLEHWDIVHRNLLEMPDEIKSKIIAILEKAVPKARGKKRRKTKKYNKKYNKKHNNISRKRYKRRSKKNH